MRLTSALLATLSDAARVALVADFLLHSAAIEFRGAQQELRTGPCTMSDEPSRHGLARHHRAMSAAAAATSDTPILIDCGELFNLMQAHRSGGWPSGGPPTIFDVRRDSIRKHVIRGSHAVGSLSTARYARLTREGRKVKSDGTQK